MADLISVCSTGEDIIVFKSRDHVLLNIHRANLHAVTDGPFVVDLAAPEGDVADLPEDGDTLELMFRHVYPGRIPSLAPLSFQKLYTLAEASENYRVGPAMNMCYTHLEYVRFSVVSHLLMMWTACFTGSARSKSLPTLSGMATVSS